MVKVIKIGEEDEETKVVGDVTQEPVIDEEPITTKVDYKIKQKFVKRVYYSIIGFLYLIICAYLVDAIYYVDGIDIITGAEYSLFGFILWVILMALIILPGYWSDIWIIGSFSTFYHEDHRFRSGTYFS